MTEFFQNIPNISELLSVFIVIFVDFCALMILVAAGRGKAHRQGEKHRGNKQ